MSILERLEDARFLYHNGRRDGALLSVLVGVAATSRRRYPHPANGDRDAFVRFLLDEHPVLLTKSNWMPTSEDDYKRSIERTLAVDSNGNRVGGWWFKVPGSDWPDELMPLAMILYKYVRCNLAHEAGLPSNVEFIETEPGNLRFSVLPDRLQLSNSLMDGLYRVVTYAPENSDLFPDIKETPADVIAWMIFRKQRDKQGPYLAKREARVASMSTK